MNGDGETWKTPPHKNILSNGLPWIFQRDSSSQVSCVLLVVRGGNSAVPAGKNGLAYLTTRLAVEIPDADKIRDLMSLAAKINVGCWEEFSVISVQCLSENLEKTLKIVAKVIKNPLFSGLRIDTIKEHMRHQSKADLDNAVNAGHEEFLKAFFGMEGYGGPVLGTKESLISIQKKDISRFYETHFTASNAFLSIVSDLEETLISGLVEKYFSALKSGTLIESAAGVLSLPEQRQVFNKKEAHQSYLGLAFPLPSFTAKKYALAYLVENVLGGGVGSRIWPIRFKEKLAYEINSSITATRAGGFLEVYLETSPEKLSLAREALKKAARELADNGLTKEDLRISQNSAWASFLKANETKEARVMTLAEFEVLGLGFNFLESFGDEIKNLSKDEMNAYLKSVFSLDRTVEVVIGPGN